jgi:hypothetical protein
MTIGSILLMVLALTPAAAIFFLAGWLVGAHGCGAVKLCAAWNHCILKQRKDVKDWTGEITKAMQRELANRERLRKAMKQALEDTGESPSAQSNAGEKG